MNKRKSELLNHLDLSVTTGTTGLGVDVASPLGDRFRLRAGFSFMPHFSRVLHFGVQVGQKTAEQTEEEFNEQSQSKFDRLSGMLEELTGYKVDNQIDMRTTPTYYNFNVLVDYFPIPRNKHWHALESSYFNTPYFEYYQDDFRPIYERRYEFLIDFNEALISKCIELTGISCDLRYTDKYIPAGDITPDRKKTNDLSTQGLSPDRAGISDYRSLISPKINVEDDKDFTPLPYYQVFSERRNGRFLPNLSIADLLFNMGPESLFILSPR